MKYSVHVRCACADPDGRPLGHACPKLWRKDGNWNSRHESAGWAARIPTSEGTRLVKRFGYGSKAETETAALASAELLGLAADDLPEMRYGQHRFLLFGRLC